MRRPVEASETNAPRDCPTKKAPENTLSSIMIAESNAALSAFPETVPGVTASARAAQLREK